MSYPSNRSAAIAGMFGASIGLAMGAFVLPPLLILHVPAMILVALAQTLGPEWIGKIAILLEIPLTAIFIFGLFMTIMFWPKKWWPARSLTP